MSRLLRAGLAAVVLVAAAVALASGTSRALRLPSDLSRLDGPGWFAMCRDPEWFRVVAVPKARTRDALGAAACPHPVFFVRGLELKHQRRVPLPFELSTGGDRGLVLGDRTWFVRAGRNPGGCSSVELTSGPRTQVVWAPQPVDGGACPEFCLSRVWAGDLEADGELDLLLRIAERGAPSTLRLFTSSLAADGALVGELASVTGPPGCE